MTDLRIARRTDPRSVCEIAPAKVNVYLHLHKKRPDGYHLLESLVVFTAFGDKVTVRFWEGAHHHLDIEGPFAPSLQGGGDNLVLKAVRFWEEHRGPLPAKVHVTLEKNLPVASGIGGGSSDGAAVLRALHALTGLSVPEEESVALGADVPVCIRGKSCVMGGIGEKIWPLPEEAVLPPALLLVTPPQEVSTAAVFQHPETQSLVQKGGSPSLWTGGSGAISRLLEEGKNDLQRAATLLAPEISTVITELSSMPHAHGGRMSGSGATCFAFFPSLETAQAGAESLRSRFPQWWICPTEKTGNGGDLNLLKEF